MPATLKSIEAYFPTKLELMAADERRGARHDAAVQLSCHCRSPNSARLLHALIHASTYASSNLATTREREELSNHLEEIWTLLPLGRGENDACQVRCRQLGHERFHCRLARNELARCLPPVVRSRPASDLDSLNGLGD